MAKDPIFPLFYNDIDRATRDWTDEEFGAYMRLLMHQWDKSGLPLGFDRLSRIAPSVEKNWGVLSQKFVDVGGMLQNSRLEEIRAERLIFKQRQAENGKKGGRPKKPTETQQQTQTEPKKKPLEAEYEDEEEVESETVFGKSENLSPDTELPQNILETCELNQFTFHQSKNTAFIKSQWKVFLTERINDPPIKRLGFQELSDYTSYFINWIRTKHPKKNGTTHQQTLGSPQLGPGIVNPGDFGQL